MTLIQAAAIATLLLAIPALAQTTHDHQSPGAPAAQSAPGMRHGQGAMGPAMMGQGMPGGIMLGQDMMMPNQRGMSPPTGLAKAAIPDRLEGRLAFIKTELGITEAQLAAWNGFAEAIRANAATIAVEQQAMHGRVGADVSLPDRLLAQANAFTAHAEEMVKLKTALDPLYASLTAEQKKTADEILFSPMGVPVRLM